MTTEVLRVVTDARDGITKIALSGELDMATVDVLADALTICERDGGKAIMLDLRDLTFMDSSGLRAFLQARARSEENGQSLLLVAPSRPVRKVFEVAGVESLLDEQEAVPTLDQFRCDSHRSEARVEPSDPRG